MGAPYIYDISRLRVKQVRLIDICDSSGESPTATTPLKVTRKASAVLDNRSKE